MSATNPPAHSALERWALFAYRRRWLVLASWVALLVGLLMLSRAFGGEFADRFTIPGSEAQEAFDTLEANFPSQAGGEAFVLFKTEAGIADPAIAARIQDTLDQLAALPFVVAVESPLENPFYVSPGGEIARSVVRFEGLPGDLPLDDLDRVYEIVDASAGDGLTVEIGGPSVSAAEREGPGNEAFGLMAAIIILLVAFGSVVAAGLPLGAAIFGLGSSFGIIGLAATTGYFPNFAPQFAAMIGIGVGIDYSLLVVTRFREGIHKGLPVPDAIVTAVATAGRSVIFAGVVVAVSFLGLSFMGIPFITAMGVTGAIVVFMAVIVAITLMPALLGFAGAHVDRLHIPLFHASEGVDPSSFWYRFSRSIQRRPLPYFIGALVLILTLASPVLDIRIGFTDDGNKSTSSRARRAYDLLAEGFGPGFNGPVLVVVDGPDAPEVAAKVAQAAATLPNVAQVFPPRVSESGTTAAVTLFPGTAPQDESTDDLVDFLRSETAPALENAETRVLVGGAVAAFEDIGARIAGRLPYLFAGVIGISFLLLMAVFRSVLVALKAAILNLLSISCSFGVLVAVFQWGWFGDIVGVSEGPIETFAPMMLFAILFGLSMDYEVFLISRIREEYVRTGDNATAVANGLTATARVITAAAAIMVSVFLSFVFGDQRVIKEFGLGLATAIFVDATIVRLILVPSTMELLGDANWWLPRWLDRLLPHFNLEGTPSPGTERSPAGAPAGGE